MIIIPIVVVANKIFNKINHHYELKLNKFSNIDTVDIQIEDDIELRPACTSINQLNGLDNQPKLVMF